jgi:hypothetical protein
LQIVSSVLQVVFPSDHCLMWRNFSLWCNKIYLLLLLFPMFLGGPFQKLLAYCNVLSISSMFYSPIYFTSNNRISLFFVAE